MSGEILDPFAGITPRTPPLRLFASPRLLGISWISARNTLCPAASPIFMLTLTAPPSLTLNSYCLLGMPLAVSLKTTSFADTDSEEFPFQVSVPPAPKVTLLTTFPPCERRALEASEAHRPHNFLPY